MVIHFKLVLVPYSRYSSGLFKYVADCQRSMRWGRGLPWSRHCKFLHITLALLKSSLLNERGTHKYLIQDGLIIENMHDVPYSFNVGPEVCACMTVVCSAVRHVCPTLPLGVQILSSANQQALAVALASGSAFHQLIRKFPSSCWVFLLLSSERHDFFFLFKSTLQPLWCVYVFQVWISSEQRVLSFLMWQTRVFWMPAPGTFWDIASRLELMGFRSSLTSRRNTGEVTICSVKSLNCRPQNAHMLVSGPMRTPVKLQYVNFINNMFFIYLL